jgi:uncharacterized repeat protein (TIGR01451 family)
MKRTFRSILRIHWQGLPALIAAGITLVLTLVASLLAQNPLAPPAFTILHSFTGPPNDGRNPITGLTLDSSGNLYGTTMMGGAFNGGTVFVVRPDGSEAVLYSFPLGNTGGTIPSGLTLGTDGNFYGTTMWGGMAGVGNIFRMAPDGTVTVLYSFAGPPNDGSRPRYGVIRDAQGNLFGTTEYGGPPCASLGSIGCGTVFWLSPDGTETILHSFAGGANDGANPMGGLLEDAAGNLYGVARAGGSTGNGVVFKLSPDGTETVLHNFAGSPNDGANPNGGLIQDSTGSLYGTTVSGGANGAGTIFELSQTGTETVLHSFGGFSSDGGGPDGNPVMDGSGNLYGTATNAVFELSPDGTLTVLHRFTGSEGGTTDSWLVLDGARNLFGTTFGSPGSPCSVEGPGGCGIVFKLATPNANLSVNSGAPSVVPSGSVVSYVIEVTNHGPDAANNVNIQDEVPAGATFNSVSASAGSCAAPAPGGTGTVTCTVPTLASGRIVTETLLVNVTAASGSTITDTVAVSSSTFDPNSAGNSATATTTVVGLPRGNTFAGKVLGGTGRVWVPQRSN